VNRLARYYDSRTGTFCSADPLASSPDDPQSWNRYPYGRNDPIDITDPSGQHWWNWVLDIGGLAAMIFAPEIDAFLGDLFGGSAAASAPSAAGADAAAPALQSPVEHAASDTAMDTAGIGPGMGEPISAALLALGQAQPPRLPLRRC